MPMSPKPKTAAFIGPCSLNNASKAVVAKDSMDSVVLVNPSCLRMERLAATTCSKNPEL